MTDSTSQYSNWLAPLAAGLLASSCCIVQLAFNLLALPCAGFSVLTPYRPFFLALTSISLAHLLWPLVRRNRSKGHATGVDASASCNTCSPEKTPVGSKGSTGRLRLRLLLAMLTLVITFSPELVGWWNRSALDGSTLVARRNFGHDHSTGASSAGLLNSLLEMSGIHASSPRDTAQSDATDAKSDSSADTTQLELKVAGIKCEACASRVKSAAMNVDGVVACQVDQRSGRTLISLAPASSIEAVQDRLMKAISALDAEYTVTVRGLHHGRQLFAERAW
ncbi:hypothetical protein THASP1DRAFT_32412 [Thamnocephalis sphaerospora]|uniref:Uncharacterized protein n=1 Tax=Thamnocephalis sphaerospora TaxID=78915 RepID=A0A4P9XJ46_9FUNG|nr:hypothetical protein THASP1DRAFT_32412 [Thamnocephalis sphaerospora]|eukprot:RKP05748.1 hypothetical protein THASP1DRAFT_32412 [Thamnocephalis sphaerospora]